MDIMWGSRRYIQTFEFEQFSLGNNSFLYILVIKILEHMLQILIPNANPEHHKQSIITVDEVLTKTSPKKVLQSH